MQQRSDGGERAERRPLLQRADLPWLLLALIVGIGLRVDWILFVSPNPSDGRFDDSAFYHGVANLLALGEGYREPWLWSPTAQWPPAYPAALAVLYKLFGTHFELAKGLNVVLAAGTIALVYVLAQRLFDRRAAAVGALAFAFFPGQIFFTTLVMTETLFAFVFTLALLFTLLWTVEREARWWQVALLGALVAYCGLVRAEGILLAPLFVVLWLFTVRPWMRLARYVPLLAAGAVLTLTPWTVRNAIQFDEFIPLRRSNDEVYGAGLDPDFEANAKLTDPQYPSSSEALAYWRDHPWEFPSFVWSKMQHLYLADDDGIFWIQSSRPVLSDDVADRWSNVANGYFFTAGALALLAIPLCLRSRRRERLALLIFGIGWSAVFIFFVPQTRYHHPVGPLVSALSGALLVASFDVVNDAAHGRLRLPSFAGVRGHERPSRRRSAPAADAD